MHKFAPIALAAMLVVNTPGVLASAKSAQIGQCTNDIRNDPNNFREKYGCNSADDAACLCKNAQFLTEIGGCAGASPVEVREDLVANTHLCNAFANLIPSVSQSPSQAPQPSDNAANTPSPSSSPSQTPTPTPESSQTPTPTPTPSEASSTAKPASSSPTATASSSRTSSSSTATKVSSETSAAATPDAAASGLSQAAMAGIGVGVAVAVIAAAVIAFLLLKKRKRQAPRHSMEISKPLPGSGRTYPTQDNDRDSFDKYANDIEMTSNRYEDMSVGQQPRTMV